MHFFKKLFLLSASFLIFSCENIDMNATKADDDKTTKVPSNLTSTVNSSETSTYAGIVSGGTLTMEFKDQSIFITYAVNNQFYNAIYKLSGYSKRTPNPPAPCTPILEGCPPRLEQLEGVFKNNRISLDSYPEFFNYIYFSYQSGSQTIGKLLDSSAYKVARVK